MDNYEEKNVTDSARKERCQAMEHMLSILYCRSVFRDFRKPVELMYPHLAQTYGTLVKRPMDLGTLLLKARRKEIVTIQEFRTTLQLVHNNALLFNEGAPLMEGISRHLEHFSEGLFEEIMRYPYHSPALAKGKATPQEVSAAFPALRLEKRRARLINIRDHPLTTSEAHRLLRMMATSGAVLVPTFLQPVVAQVKQALASRLSVNDATPVVQDGTVVLEISLRSVLRPLLRAAATFSSAQVSPAGAVLLDAVSDPTEAPRAVRSECLAYLGSLEEQLALLAVMIEERVLRGTAYSSIWAVPSSQFVYAQSISMTTTSEGKSRSPWWPCMIIASGATAPVPAVEVSMADSDSLSGRPVAAASYQMPSDILRANLARIPADIGKQLIKLRPRVMSAPTAASLDGHAESAVAVSAAGLVDAPGAAHPLSPPEGYMLLEYFGAHDFGWVKCDSVQNVYDINRAEDGYVEIAKLPAPGKHCNKDIIAEADEAWSVLIRQKRREGLCGKGLRTVRHFIPAVAPTAGAEDEITFMAVDAAREARETKEAAQLALQSLSQESDGETEDLDQDLPAPPGLSELEDSVDVPYSADLFEAQVAPVVNGDAHTGGNSTSSAGGSQGKTQKSNSHRASRKSGAADNYFDDGSGPGGPGTYYVPGPRKGSFVPAAVQNVVHFAPAKEDRRLYFATAEDILRFRSSVEYVLPEDLTMEDYKNCVQDGKFHASLCPLPLPSLEPSSPDKARPPVEEFVDDLIIVDPATRATFRPKALMRTKALSFYLSSARPLHFDHYSPTPSKRSHAQVHAQTHAQTQLSSASAAASGESPASAAGGTSAVALAGADAAMLGAEETAKGKKTGSDLVPIKPEKRKYVFKNRPAPSAASVAVPAGEEGVAAPTEAPSAPPAPAPVSAPITAANIHVPANLTLSASCFVLDTGCSRFAAGDGSVYTRTVDTNGKIFQMEAKSCSARKRILRAELAALQAAIDQLQQVSQQRQMRENERKIRFQQLQQQQLQQLQHQQLYALQAQQQHKQYLMQLMDQHHQLQEQQLQSMVAPGARKASSKPKAPKATVPSTANGAAPAPKAKASKSTIPPGTVIYTADSSTALAAGDAASNGDSASSDPNAVVLPLVVTLPKKKSRSVPGADVEVKYGESGEPIKPPAKRSKAKHAAKELVSADAALVSPQSTDAPSSMEPDAGTASSAGFSLLNALDVLASAALNSPPSAPLPVVSSPSSSNGHGHGFISGSAKVLKRKMSGSAVASPVGMVAMSAAGDGDGMSMDVEE